MASGRRAPDTAGFQFTCKIVNLFQSGDSREPHSVLRAPLPVIATSCVQGLSSLWGATALSHVGQDNAGHGSDAPELPVNCRSGWVCVTGFSNAGRDHLLPFVRDWRANTAVGDRDIRCRLSPGQDAVGAEPFGTPFAVT